MPISSVAGMTQHQMLKSKVPGSDVIVSNHPLFPTNLDPLVHRR